MLRSPTAPGLTRAAAWLVMAGWEGCSADPAPPHAYDPRWSLDPGPPMGPCAEVEGTPGVFSRRFAHGNASLDCNAWAATLRFPEQHEQIETAWAHRR